MPAQTPQDRIDDLTLTFLLKEVGCPTPLNEIKPFLLGCIAADEMPSLDTILSILWDGEEPTFASADQAERFVTSLMALWNQLAHRVGDRPFVLSGAPRISTVEDVRRMVERRQSEAYAFLTGLAAGRTDVRRLPKAARESHELLEEMLGTWADYEYVCQVDVSPDAETLAETAAALREFDEVANTAMWAIALAQQLTRLKNARTAHGSLKPLEPGRNDPCPCGSGKKYKKCCGQR